MRTLAPKANQACKCPQECHRAPSRGSVVFHSVICACKQFVKDAGVRQELLIGLKNAAVFGLETPQIRKKKY